MSKEVHGHRPSKGRLFVIAAPSGGGKTSLVRALLERDDRVSLSVSHTTRSPRPGEVDGEHYHFVTPETFQSLVEKGEFLEFARVYDQFYGTGRSAVEEQLANGRNVLLDIDWQGARQVRENYPEVVTIFILPPSLPELRQRLKKRAQDSDEIIDRRMRAARDEISHHAEFDHILVNDQFESALNDLHLIIRSEQPTRQGQNEKIALILEELMANG